MTRIYAPDELKSLVDRARRMSPRLGMMDCETLLQMADAFEAQAAEITRLRDALAPCVNLLNGLVAESGREVSWGEEDSFRMGEWFEKHDIDMLASARAALKGTTK